MFVGTFFGVYVLWVLLSECFELWFEPPESSVLSVTVLDVLFVFEDELLRV